LKSAPLVRKVTKDAEPEYIYRIPRSTRALALLLLYPTPLYVAVAVAVLERSWLVGTALALPVALSACLALWLWSKATIVIDSERIHWPLKRRELRWDGVASSRIARLLGTEYARIETEDGKVRRIVLNRVGGEEYRTRVPAKLGLN